MTYDPKRLRLLRAEYWCWCLGLIPIALALFFVNEMVIPLLADPEPGGSRS